MDLGKIWARRPCAVDEDEVGTIKGTRYRNPCLLGLAINTLSASSQVANRFDLPPLLLPKPNITTK